MSCQFFPFLFNSRLSLRNPWEYRRHLRCLALCAAFPHSLVRRDSHDYYQRSVTISLS
jgi:hypothetical protein